MLKVFPLHITSIIRLRNLATTLGVVLAVSGLLLSPAVAEAHDLEQNSGYTAVLHIDPDDDPHAGQPEVLNFLIGKIGAAYDQNDYDISLNVSLGHRQLQHLSVQPEEFGNAGDGLARYTFAKPGIYTLDLRGALKADNSSQFHMRYSVNVAATAASAAPQTSNKLPTLLVFGGSGLVLLAVVGYVTMRGAKRSADNSH